MVFFQSQKHGTAEPRLAPGPQPHPSRHRARPVSRWGEGPNQRPFLEDGRLNLGNSQSDGIAADHSRKHAGWWGSNRPHAVSKKPAWDDSMRSEGMNESPRQDRGERTF
jgi:hypothetical protein